MNININGFNFNTGNGNYNRSRRRTGTAHVINKPWQSILFCAIFVLIGIGLLIFGINSNLSFKEKSESFVETTATVVDYDYSSDGLAAIVVEYIVDGKNYKSTSDSKSSHPKSIGSIVKIKYNPDYPNDMIWMSNNGTIFIPLLGALFIIVGGIGIFTSVKKGLSEGFDSGTNEVYTYSYDSFGNRHFHGQNNEPSRFDYSNQMNMNNNSGSSLGYNEQINQNNGSYSDFGYNNQMNQYPEQNYNMGQNQNNDFSQMSGQNNNQNFQNNFNSNNQDNNNLNNF